MPNLAQVLFGLVVILGLCIAGLCRSHHVNNQRLDELEGDVAELLDQWAGAVEDCSPPPVSEDPLPGHVDHVIQDDVGAQLRQRRHDADRRWLCVDPTEKS
ncbi:hypothetical protein [Kribbella sp. CA-293567]|uniref:hypothetical protein n=1 Tax=Kribbella sp. CA-293567 TaxID=3002436 RepID=UPI0022DD3C75|nr:hypothetical protein [Kribbella sp. CA-293567]WBQ02994.1 hypothetical protein OX958_23790 [Kribbella sp. CA-293567]